MRVKRGGPSDEPLKPRPRVKAGIARWRSFKAQRTDLNFAERLTLFLHDWNILNGEKGNRLWISQSVTGSICDERGKGGGGLRNVDLTSPTPPTFLHFALFFANENMIWALKLGQKNFCKPTHFHFISLPTFMFSINLPDWLNLFSRTLGWSDHLNWGSLHGSEDPTQRSRLS